MTIGYKEKNVRNTWNTNVWCLLSLLYIHARSLIHIFLELPIIHIQKNNSQ